MAFYAGFPVLAHQDQYLGVIERGVIPITGLPSFSRLLDTEALIRSSIFVLKENSLALYNTPTDLSSFCKEKLVRKILPNENWAENLCLSGMNHKRERQYNKAVLSYLGALSVYRMLYPTQNSEIFPKLHLAIGFASLKDGDSKKAIENAEIALTIFEEKLPRAFKFISQALSTLSSAYFLENNFTKALRYALKSHDLATKVFAHNSVQIFFSYTALSAIYSRLGEFEKSSVAFTEAIKIQNTLSAPS